MNSYKSKMPEKRYLVFTMFMGAIFFTACSYTTKNETKLRERFQVTYPLVLDTSYYSDYVSDIHSIKNVEIRARVKGYIEKIHVDEGKTVKKGQTLFSISNQEYR